MWTGGGRGLGLGLGQLYLKWSRVEGIPVVGEEARLFGLWVIKLKKSAKPFQWNLFWI